MLLCLRFELSKISMTLLKGNAFACKLLTRIIERRRLIKTQLRYFGTK